MRKVFWVLVPAATFAFATVHEAACVSSTDCGDLGTCGNNGGAGGAGGAASSAATTTTTTTSSSTGAGGEKGDAGDAGDAGGAGGAGAGGAGAGGTGGAPVVCQAKRWGASANQEAQSLHVDGAGKIVLAGTFQGTLDIGGDSLNQIIGDAGTGASSSSGASSTSASASASSSSSASSSASASSSSSGGTVTIPNLFAVELDPTGTTAAWSIALPVKYLSSAVDTTTGNVYLAGIHAGASVTLPGGCALDPTKQSFVAEIDPATKLCVSASSFAASPSRASLAVDTMTGNVFLAGGMNGVVDFGQAAPPTTTGEDIFVVGLDPQLSNPWVLQFGSPNDDEATGVGVDETTGDVIITGTIDGLVDFDTGGNPLDSGSVPNVFVASLSQDDQTTNWAKSFASASAETAGGLAVLPLGGVAVAGGYQGTLTFGATTLTSTATSASFAVLLSYTDGSPLWASPLGGTSVTAIGASASGQTAYAVGTGGDGTLVTQLDLSGDVTGTMLLSGAAGSQQGVLGLGFTPASPAKLAVGGYFTGTLGSLVSAGGNDVFLEICP